MKKVDKDRNRFLQRELPIARIGVLVGVVIFIIFYLFDFIIGVGTGAFLVMIFSSYHNFKHFSQLDEEDMKSLRSIWTITHWLIAVLISSSVFLSIVIFKLKLLDRGSVVAVGLLIISFGLSIGVLNLWYPRIRRQEVLRKSREPEGFRDRFQKMLRQHYRIVGEEPPNWKKLEQCYLKELDSEREDSDSEGEDSDSEGKDFDFFKRIYLKLKIRELELQEARTVYMLKEFIETETKFADRISLLISCAFTLLVAILQSWIVEVFLN